MNKILYINNEEFKGNIVALEMISSRERPDCLNITIESPHFFQNDLGSFLFLFCYESKLFCANHYYISNMWFMRKKDGIFQYNIKGVLYNTFHPDSFLLKYHDLLLTLNCHPSYTQAEYVQLCTSERIQKVEKSDLIL